MMACTVRDQQWAFLQLSMRGIWPTDSRQVTRKALLFGCMNFPGWRRMVKCNGLLCYCAVLCRAGLRQQAAATLPMQTHSATALTRQGLQRCTCSRLCRQSQVVRRSRLCHPTSSSSTRHAVLAPASETLLPFAPSIASPPLQRLQFWLAWWQQHSSSGSTCERSAAVI